jgi:hypothetical protein
MTSRIKITANISAWYAFNADNRRIVTVNIRNAKIVVLLN